MRLGRIAALYSWSLASAGIIFLRRTKTLTFLLACLHNYITYMFTEFKLIIQCNPAQFEVWGGLDGISIRNVYIYEMVAVFPSIYQHCIVLVIVSLQELSPL